MGREWNSAQLEWVVLQWENVIFIGMFYTWLILSKSLKQNWFFVHRRFHLAKASIIRDWSISWTICIKKLFCSIENYRFKRTFLHSVIFLSPENFLIFWSWDESQKLCPDFFVFAEEFPGEALKELKNIIYI